MCGQSRLTRSLIGGLRYLGLVPCRSRRKAGKIRILRAERGWSQAELAARVQVSRNSINAVENGKFDPSLPLAFRIADAFGVSVEQVFLRGAN